MIDLRYYQCTPASERHMRRQSQNRAMGCCYTHAIALRWHVWMLIRRPSRVEA